MLLTCFPNEKKIKMCGVGLTRCNLVDLTSPKIIQKLLKT